MNLRNETDFLGTKELPEDALYGIQSLRALENFPSFVPFKTEWYKAMGTVKLACYLTYKKYLSALRNINAGKGSAVNIISDEKIDALITSAGEMAEGKWQEHFIVPAVSGGAGTSINMNINEILANVALLKLGHKPGEYEIVDPVETSNVFQSTNDVVPTALKVAVMRLLQEL